MSTFVVKIDIQNDGSYVCRQSLMSKCKYILDKMGMGTSMYKHEQC